MYIAIVQVSVLPDGSYFIPLDRWNYGGETEERVIVTPVKRELLRKLRDYGMSPIQIFRTVREIPPCGMDALVRIWDPHYHRTLWESDPSQ